MEWDRRYTYLVFVILCLAVLITATAAADLTVVWNRTYGGADGNESAYAVMEYPNGTGYLFAGETDAYGAGGTDAWVVTITGDGDEIWNMTYGRGENDTARAVIPADNATALFAGTYTFIADSVRRDTDAWAVAINDSGGEIWNRKYGGGEVNATAASVANASDGGYLFAGSLEPYGTGSTDALVVKVNESGGEVWNQTYGRPDANETASAIVALPGGGYAFAGAAASPGTEGTNAWIVLIDENGSEVWNTTYGSAGDDAARAIAVTTEGDLLVAGMSAVTREQNRTDTEAFVLRLAGNGSTVWNVTYAAPGENTSANAVIQADDAGVLVAGEQGLWGAEDSDALLIKFDGDGREIWNWTYGGTFRDRANALLQTAEDEYVFAGTFTTRGSNSTDAWVVKLRAAAAPTPTPVTPTPTTPTPTPTASPRPGINLTKYTNGIEAKVPPGPVVTLGDTVMWTYNVTNNGTVPLMNISVIDDRVGPISGPDAGDTNTNGILDPNETWVYRKNGTAVNTATLPGGSYTNNATVTAEDAGKTRINATDVSHYTSAAINFTKFTDGEDSKVPPGPVITVGEVVTWTYNVTNTGAVPLTNVSVNDDRLGPISGPLQADNNGVLDPGETWTYEATGTAMNTSQLPGGYYENNATVTADNPAKNQVTATDVSHYTSKSLSDIEFIKLTEAEDAKTPPGPTVFIGGPVTWTYQIVNTGAVPLANVQVTDDQIGPVRPQAGPPFEINGNYDDLLDPGETWIFEIKGVAVNTSQLPGGYYTNNATVTADDPDGNPVAKTDVSHYTSTVGPGVVAITKYTNGEDASSPPYPEIAAGDPVTWTYEVTNTGTVPLANVQVTDDMAGPITGPPTGDDGNGILDPGETWTYTADDAAQDLQGGIYENTVTVTAAAPYGLPPIATDVSHYVNPATPTTLPTTTPTTPSANTTTPPTTTPTTPSANTTTPPTTTPTTPSANTTTPPTTTPTTSPTT